VNEPSPRKRRALGVTDKRQPQNPVAAPPAQIKAKPMIKLSLQIGKNFKLSASVSATLAITVLLLLL
jgi:hypothetical protein